MPCYMQKREFEVHLFRLMDIVLNEKGFTHLQKCMLYDKVKVSRNS